MTNTIRPDLDDVDAPLGAPDGAADDGGLRRRTFMGWVLAGTTLTVAADLGFAQPARAVIPSGPQVADLYDLEDLQRDSAAPTSQLITITITKKGRAVFELPRSEVGQGIITSTTMLIAEELDLPMEKVDVKLAPARPELVYNQLTGGSNTCFSTYTPVRTAAAIARQQLLDAAAIQFESAADRLITSGGVVIDPVSGGRASYGELARAAAKEVVEAVEVTLRAPEKFRVIGTPQRRTDARDIVTGKKKFTPDLDIPNALPTMVCKAPTHKGTPRNLRNLAEIKAMPGVTHVAQIPTGIAVRARTFGQCIDAIRKMKVNWNPGLAAEESDESVLEELRAAEIPLAVPEVPGVAKTVETDVVFAWKSSAALEPYGAIADVRDDSAEIWAGLKSPIVAQANIADDLGLPQTAVKVNVITAGGSFGHRLFPDHARDAAAASKEMGVPVKLMWHRADEPRQGRQHPMATSRVRATYGGGNVLSFEQQHTSVLTDYSHGLGERFSNLADESPGQFGNYSISQGIFALTQQLPYNFGVVAQALNETIDPSEVLDERFNTGAMRNVYSPDVCTAAEMTIDKLAKVAKMDPVAFRLKFIKDPRVKAVLRKVAKEGRFGRSMPKGTAQGVALHKEYKGCTAVLVEIDCRSAMVNRDLGPETITGPRVTKVVIAVDAGLVINPRGLRAQMEGGAMDGIAQTLTSSCHLKDGRFQEASWDNYFYTRQWNAPFSVEVHIVDSGGDHPGGAGEAAVGSTAAAVANAYARATGKFPTVFPIIHNDPLAFKPKSFIPSVPQSPTNGLKRTF